MRLLTCLICLAVAWPAAAEEPQASQPATSNPTLAQLASGELKIVDLTWALNAENAFWPGDQYEPFHLRTIATLERDGVLSKAFATPEHLGTHLDAPNHFERNQPSVDQIPAEQLFAPGVVIDVSAAVMADPDYRLGVEDIERWESEHGPIPQRAVVLLHTGWSRFWGNPVRYQNRDVRGKLHFPGYSQEAAEFLIARRDIKGLGIDTLSIDHGLSRDFIVHHVVNRYARYGLENVARLGELPARGFYVVVAPIKIETGSGGPTRLFAIVP